MADSSLTAASEAEPTAEPAVAPAQARSKIFGDDDSDDSSSDDEEVLQFGAAPAAPAAAAAAAPAAAAAAAPAGAKADSDSDSSSSSSSSSSDSSDSDSSSDDEPKKKRSRLRKGAPVGGKKRGAAASSAAAAKRQRRVPGAKLSAAGRAAAGEGTVSRAPEGDEYDSGGEVEATEEDRAFLDTEGDDQEFLDEYNQPQIFNDERPEERKKKRKQPKGNALEQALARMKGTKERSKALDPQDMEEAVTEFLGRMDNAAIEDGLSYERSEPGVRKVAMRDEVERVLAKGHWHTDLLERNLLAVIKHWIDPLPDGSLSNLDTRTMLLQAMQDMPIEKDHLKRSELGKTVMALWKSPKETAANKVLLKALIEKWSRPIYQKSTDYRNVAAYEERGERSRPQRAQRAGVDLGQEEKSGPAERFMRVPQPVNLIYKRRSNQRVVEVPVIVKPDKDSTKAKLKNRMAQLARPAQKNKRAVSMSIEGR